jgi:beta-lactamase superfamily II metal-dependent hydrolase
MLENLKPEYAIISVGKNSYGHPAPQVLRLLDEYNVKTYRTDTDNAVKLETDGNKIIYYTFDNEKNKWQKRKN